MTPSIRQLFQALESILALALIALVPAATHAAEAQQQVDFSRDILPLLSENCFQCHGPDEATREAGLRLDQRDGILAEADSGIAAVIPESAETSELIKRIISEDADLLMPPPESGKKLSATDIERLKQWINTGAKWSVHWAYEKPESDDLPASDKNWEHNNPIDLFILAGVKKAGLSPSAQASKETLIRRATLDLTGLPPTIAEIDQFLSDESPNAFERVLDRVMESPAYAENMTRIWLDAARYADTHGLHLDNERSIWPYRDWVIDAFQKNMPFDQFTIEQLAGDLLPEPTLQQRIATGFNRCNVTTSEGGSIDDEYYVRYAVDRVETTSTVWLGLTSGCAACHDHKFDPLTQKEFYQMFSYFFSLTERAMDGNNLLPPPVVKVPSQEQAASKVKHQQNITTLNNRITELIGSIEYNDAMADATLGELKQGDAIWFDDALPPGAKPQGDGPYQWKFVPASEHPVHSGKNSSIRTGTGLTQHFFDGANPKLKLGNPGRLFAYVYLDPENPPETIQLQFNDGSWNHRAYWGADKAHGAGQKGPANFHAGKLPETGKWIRLEVDAASVGLKPESEINGWAFTQFGGTVHWDAAGVVSLQSLPTEKLASLNLWKQYRKKVTSPPIPAEIQKILDVEAEKQTDDQHRKVKEYYLQNVHPEHAASFAKIQKNLEETKKALADVEKSIPATLVMEDRKEPRQAHVLERGQYTEKRDAVSSAVPQWIAPLPEGAPNNRLGLASWLVSPENPLTARVTVNRFWLQHFGMGLVKTAEDFGIQGEQPSHPELLDWLALEFIESGWNMKQLHKLIMMSATYQQSSKVTPEQLQNDPENRLLSRGPRFRLDAEVIRDNALATSGLLVRDVGGKSVRPYQPSGLWKAVGFGGSNTSVFAQDKGEKLYRRSMYTFWKRTSPPPSMSTFDAPDRETCQVRRARTNTPLQSLVLMNDVQFVEAARKLAERVLHDGGSTPTEQLVFAFRTTTSRFPEPYEQDSLMLLHKEYLQEFQSKPENATKLLSAGESPRDTKLPAADLAAWTMICHLLLNLSETVTQN